MIATKETSEKAHGAATSDDATATWAARLAQRRWAAQEAAHAPRADAAVWLPGAITLLWALLDEAVSQANQALEQAGLDERIAVRRTEREYWLGLPGPDGGERQIAVFVSARPHGAAISGGAHVTTSETRARIDLVPTAEGGRLRWLIPAAGRELTAGVVDDLILSVFADDAEAARHLSGFYTADDG